MKKIPNINLYHGDCMEAMKDMPDNAYDLAIVDPPYGIGIVRSPGGSMTINKTFDNNRDKWDIKPNVAYFTELDRVCKNYIVWGGNHFASYLKNSAHWIYWDKRIVGDLFSNGELAYTSFGVSYNEKNPMSIRSFSCSVDRKKIHLTQKPVALYKWLLKNYAKEGDKILDTHGGSMSIAIACHDMGFDLDLWELDEDYYKAGCKRFKNHTDQMQLF